jgi:hypothetical protein
MKLLVAIATIGALLRVRNYQFARSMWLDEIALAVSLRDIGFPEILTSPLLNRQSASPGYLVASKAAVRIFGTDEYGLRLVALISGIATLVLAVLIAQRLLTRRWAQVGFVSLIAFSPALIYYSNEVKQYSTDVMATSAVLVLWSLRRHRRAPLILGLSGAVIALISLPGIIALAALGIALLIERLTVTFPGAPPAAPTGIWARLRDLISIAALWSIGIGLHLFYSFSVGTDREFMRTWWGERGAFPPGTASDLGWYPQWLARLGWVGIGHEGRVGSVTPITATVVTVTLDRNDGGSHCGGSATCPAPSMGPRPADPDRTGHRPVPDLPDLRAPLAVPRPGGAPHVRRRSRVRSSLAGTTVWRGQPDRDAACAAIDHRAHCLHPAQ